MCHVCKRFGDGVQLKRCGGCKMIAYCGKEHQKQHWKQHKPLCKAIQGELQNYNMDFRGETSQEWTDKKVTFAKLVSSRLGRRLNESEKYMLYLPRECLVCHEPNIKSLESCQKCAVSFCKNHKDGTEHTDICAPLELCLSTDLFFMRESSIPLDMHLYLPHISCTSTFQNMKEFIQLFIKAYRNIQTDSELSCNARAAIDSDYLTRSLTLFYAMQLLNFVPKIKDLVVHVVDAREGEEMTWFGWEILPCLIGTMVPVKVIFIGPELLCKLNPLHDCDNCMSREKKCLTFKFHNVLYENYVSSSSFEKPNLVVGFHFGFHLDTIEMWAPFIELIAKQNCPLILTSFTPYFFKKQTGIINIILNKKVDHIYSGENPFASLKPHRTFGVYKKYVAYRNHYVNIYRSLCSDEFVHN